MNTKQLVSISLAYTLLIGCLQTAISLTPGLLLIEDRVTFSFGTLILVCYLLLAECFQVFIRIAHKEGRRVTMQAYGLKSAVAIFLLWGVAGKLSFQYGIILLAYEVFQYLTFSDKYQYQDTYLSLITASFFKGLVFNLMISLSAPYTFKLLYLQPYLFSLLLLLWYEIINQQLYARTEATNARYYLKMISVLTALGVYLAFCLKSGQLPLYVLVLITSIVLVGSGLALVNTQTKKREFVISLLLMCCLLLFYSI